MKTWILIALIFTLGIDIAKGDDPILAIKLNNDSPVQYCTAPVIVAGNLTIEGTFAITGMKISIGVGFVSGEDELVYSGAISSIKGTWDQNKGVMLLTKNGSVTPTNFDYRDAIQGVTYKNNKAVPTLGTRKISITLDDADYLDETKHFYQFISKPGIKWTQARDEAAATLYHGLLRGYLATILSQGESDFINLKTIGEGWIGASDAKVEEEWRWVTGPEGLMDGGDGLLFWKGSGIKAKLNNPPGVYGPVIDPKGNPYYFNWNNWDSFNGDNCTYEPNNWANINNVVTCGASNVPGEDYAHITSNKKWNDYANDNQSTSGYLIEFGGMEDYTLNLSATVDLQVNTVIFNSGTIASICQGKSVTLNQPDKNSVPATYSWSPAATLSDAQISNPVATPAQTTSYSVSASRGSCKENRDFKVPVIPLPKVTFSIDSTTCYGYNIDVAYTGDANPSISTFTWIFGGETIGNGTGIIHENIPVGINQSKRYLKLIVEQNGCSDSSTLNNILVTPDLSPWTVKDSERCLPDSFQFSVMNPNPLVHYDWNFGDGTTGSGSNPGHKYLQSGKYDIQLKVTNSDNCSNTATIAGMVYAAPLPVAAFSLSDSIVYSYNPTVAFQDMSTLASKWLWSFGDSTSAVVQNPVHYYTAKGYRTIQLNVSSEYDCKDSVSHRVLIAFDRLFPPNGFSPNAPDPIDRVFLLNSKGIRTEGYHFTVRSRWDDLVFEANNEIKGWDGRLKNGSFAPPGAYIWLLDFVDFLGSLHRQTGVVTLIY